jgi:hypothetical protein
MGTSLTGLTPATTYDALIKVGDNGPLSATAKYLSDGLGNDSILALSTTALGIGTATPDLTLHLYSSAAALAYFESTNANGAYAIWRNSGTSIGDVGSALGITGTGSASNFMIASRSGDMILGSSSAERMRITSAGNVGIGTTTASRKLVVQSADSEQVVLTSTNASNLAGIFFNPANTTFSSFIGGTANDVLVKINGTERIRVTENGLTFNGDTAAANALDDYEEGTWTMGVSFGGASTGVTYSINTGTYTKIGRQVTVNGYLALTSKGSSTGNVKITGLPFTIANTTGNYCASTFWLADITFTNQFQGYGNVNETTIDMREITSLGTESSLTDADFANNSRLMVNLTYFV